MNEIYVVHFHSQNCRENIVKRQEKGNRQSFFLLEGMDMTIIIKIKVYFGGNWK